MSQADRYMGLAAPAVKKRLDFILTTQTTKRQDDTASWFFI